VRTYASEYTLDMLSLLRYCISLVDPRQLHEAERELFRFLREKDIPLVFVLTKYDAFVGGKVMEAVEDMELATPEDWRNARIAAQEHIADLRGYLESTMGYGVKVQEVSKAAKGAITDHFLLRLWLTETLRSSIGTETRRRNHRHRKTKSPHRLVPRSRRTRSAETRRYINELLFLSNRC